MNLLILETANNEMLEDKFKNIPRTSRLYVTTKNFQRALGDAMLRPVLTDRWLVFIPATLTRAQRNSLLEIGKNINIIKTYSKNSFNSIKAELIRDGVEFKIYDTTHIPEDEAKMFVRKSLGVDDEIAEYICKRHKYYYPKICESVTILKGFDKITKTVVQRYTDANDVFISHIVEALLGVPSASPKKACRCVYKFQYGLKYLYTEIIKYLELYYYVFGLVYSGYLTAANFETYVKEDTELKIYAPYQIQKIINHFNYISYDKVCLRLAQVKRIKPKRTEIYKLIMLIWEVG